MTSKMRNTGRKFSLVVFGATGFTGKTVVEEIVKTIKAGHSEPFTWAVAGRSTKKMREVLETVSIYTGTDLRHIATIEADLTDSSSLEEMTRQCTLVLNTVGPFAKFGERVIKACIRTQTHQLDLNAEPHSLTDLQVRYNHLAEETGVYIIGSCGFHSILNECGINYLQKEFEGDLNSIESYFYTGPHLRSTRLNYGMWTSVVHFYAEFSKLRPLLRRLYPNDLPLPKYKLKKHFWIHRDEVGGVGWCVPFPHPDIWAVERSQHYFYEKEKKRPIQFAPYLKQSNLFTTVIFTLAALFLILIVKLPGGVFLLDQFPRLFSGGIISTSGPTRAQMERFKYSMTIKGKGWNRPLNRMFEGNDYTTAPNKEVVLKISGINPSFGSARTCMVQAALTFLAERDSLPKLGGVYTPGTAFANTSIVERLKKHGLKFHFI